VSGDRLDGGTVDQALAAAGSPWTREGDRIVLERRFAAYLDGIAFVDEVARLADGADHHPDIEVHYTTVRLVLWTHTAGGLTQLDLDLAGRVAALP
jgi:4a-hydroxytetrahydrobiopterin dehydratase